MSLFQYANGGSTDKGKVENELFAILFCACDDTQQQTKTCARYFCLLEPKKVDANGLLECMSTAMKSMGVENIFERVCVF